MSYQSANDGTNKKVKPQSSAGTYIYEYIYEENRWVPHGMELVTKSNQFPQGNVDKVKPKKSPQ